MLEIEITLQTVGIIDGGSILGSVFDEHHFLLEFELDEVLVVEYLLEVLLWVIIQLFQLSNTMMRNSSKKTPSLLLPLLEKNLKSRLIFSFSLVLKILAAY